MVHQQKRDNPRGYLSFVFGLISGLAPCSVALPQNKVRIPAAERVELALKRPGEEYCPKGKILGGPSSICVLFNRFEPVRLHNQAQASLCLHK